MGDRAAALRWVGQTVRSGCCGCKRRGGRFGQKREASNPGTGRGLTRKEEEEEEEEEELSSTFDMLTLLMTPSDVSHVTTGRATRSAISIPNFSFSPN